MRKRSETPGKKRRSRIFHRGKLSWNWATVSSTPNLHINIASWTTQEINKLTFWCGDSSEKRKRNSPCPLRCAAPRRGGSPRHCSGIASAGTCAPGTPLGAAWRAPADSCQACAFWFRLFSLILRVQSGKEECEIFATLIPGQEWPDVLFLAAFSIKKSDCFPVQEIRKEPSQGKKR